MADSDKTKKSKAVPKASGIKVYCAFDEVVDITKIIPNPRNPNRHPERQIELLAKIIKNQGWRAPITISRRSGFVVRGGGRYEAAKLLHSTEVPVDFQDYASDAEEWADLIADNRIAELAYIDETVLKDLVSEIDVGDFDMDLTGFDNESLEKLMTWVPDESNLPDDLPPPEVEGLDTSMGRLILVYGTPEEKQRWFDLLGLEGQTNQVVFSLADLKAKEEEPTEQKVLAPDHGFNSERSNMIAHKAVNAEQSKSITESHTSTASLTNHLGE